MTNQEKITKLAILLEYAIINIHTTELLFDRDDVWNKIDKIIRITEIIDVLKNKGEKIADE
jgi:flagellin-specific chaperone FliS